MAELTFPLLLLGWGLAFALFAAWWRALDRAHYAEARAEAAEQLLGRDRHEGRPCPWPEAADG